MEIHVFMASSLTYKYLCPVTYRALGAYLRPDLSCDSLPPSLSVVSLDNMLKGLEEKKDSLEPSKGNDCPPPYDPSINPPARSPCTCPPHTDRVDGSETATANNGDGDGMSGAKIAKIVGGVALVGVAVPVLATAGAALILPAIGFTSMGVAGGSLAALAQSVLYGASTGGVFSVLQSVGATIVAPAAIEVVGAVGAAAVGAGAIAEAAAGSEGDARGQTNATHDPDTVACTCEECVCEEDCECACRRKRRGRHG
ncbi:hypothetical protein C8Q80DRAFT_1125696 [Daedaleopsis nitida]|nr:hypothetical protein C8Q80DRAFT_1125696 [Daedaleopsis nitida]